MLADGIEEEEFV